MVGKQPQGNATAASNGYQQLVDTQQQPCHAGGVKYGGDKQVLAMDDFCLQKYTVAK